MKKLIYFIVIICISSCQVREIDLKVITFNIRMDTSYDEHNSWDYRKDNAAQMLKEADADIIGMQEVLINQLNDLKSALPEYNSIGVGRIDGEEDGEFSPLFYKKERFNEKQSGYFWLSEDPAAIGQKGWDAACERIATWAVLQEKISGKEFFVLSTHFDHIGETARQESSKLILQKINEFGGNLPRIIVGDFNAEPDSETVRILTDVTNENALSDSKSIAKSVKGPDWSYHAYGNLPENERSLIDFIFVDSQITVLEYEVLPEKNETGYFSDHSAVAAKLQIK
jgi:Metal-dependent hydrolase